MNALPVTIRFKHAPAACSFHFFVDSTTSICDVLVMLDDGQKGAYSITNAADKLGKFFTNGLGIALPIACCFEDSEGNFTRISYRETGEFVGFSPLVFDGQPINDIRVAIEQTAGQHTLDHLEIGRGH